jgi:hypothetical protein
VTYCRGGEREGDCIARVGRGGDYCMGGGDGGVTNAEVVEWDVRLFQGRGEGGETVSRAVERDL